jgi:hypothetical protein
MCTLLLAVRPTPETLLAISANRNEFLARAASPMATWPIEGGGGRIVAPKDGKAGGTWLGVNQQGLFVGLTNRRHATVDAERSSRGRLVVAALALPSAQAVYDFVGGMSATKHNGFHLVVADLHRAFVAVCDGKTIERHDLGPGLHVVTERSFGAGEGRREERVRAEYDVLFAAGEPTLESLRRPMQSHEDGETPLEASCVHAELFGYGTRSSFQLLVPTRSPVSAIFSEGPTCTAPIADVSRLLAPFYEGRRGDGK